MRKFISGLLAIAAAAFTGCYESGTDADNTSREARISISPAAIGFDADGRTTDGLAFGTYIVTVNPYGKMYSDWHAELVGTDWATLDYHTASPDGAVEKALRITCSANTDYKRTGTLRVTLSKTGESVDFSIMQVGLKPDATLTLSTESDIEMMAMEPAEVTVTFETNMPASTVTAKLEEGVEWLTCTLDREAGTIVLAASDNTSPTDMREATVTVSAGTEDTSLATRQIKVRQLANGEQLPSLADFIDVVLEAGTTRLWLDVKNITIDGKSTEEGREASARACERACEIIEEMGAQNFCEFIVTGNATKISSSSPVTIWQRSLAAAGAVGSTAGWLSCRNPADYISDGYPWANLSTENLYFEGKTVNKNGYSVQKFLDAGLKLSVYNADLDVDMDYYLTYKDKLYAICTNYPRKLLGKWN